ncbi:hypothetical protein STENM36S_02087 [Streptomyces tendae]
MQTRATPATATPLERFNTAPADEAAQTLLACLNSRAWAHRLVAHRPSGPSALLAAADEAAYDLSPDDLTQALAAETLPTLPEDTYAAAHTALSAAHAASSPASDTCSSSAWPTCPRPRPWTTS